MKRKPGFRRVALIIAFVCMTLVSAACDELGPGARGEQQVTALQSVGRDRQCIPLADMNQIRWGQDAAIEVLLRDGTRWASEPEETDQCPQPRSDALFAAPRGAGELCAGDSLMVMSRSTHILRIDGECRLERFQRI